MEKEILFKKKNGKWFRVFPDRVSEEVSKEKVKNLQEFAKFFLGDKPPMNRLLHI